MPSRAMDYMPPMADYMLRRAQITCRHGVTDYIPPDGGLFAAGAA